MAVGASHDSADRVRKEVAAVCHRGREGQEGQVVGELFEGEGERLTADDNRR